MTPGQIDGAVSIPEFPGQCDDYDDDRFMQRDNELRDALRRFISAGGDAGNLTLAIEGVLEEYS